MAIASAAPTPVIRRRQVPARIVADQVVVARPGVDEAMVLGGAAALVWLELDGWITEAELADVIASTHPEICSSGSRPVLGRALRMLDVEGLLERRRD